MQEVPVKHKFTWMEFSGCLGDLGLFIPLVVAMTISCDLDIGIIFIITGILNIVTGVLFRQPIPVQPMKALAVIVIAEGMLKDELFAAGLMMAVILIFSSTFIGKFIKQIPSVLVRAIQLGIGLKLALKGAEWIIQLPLVGIDSVLLAFVIGCVLLFMLNRNIPGLVYIFLFGFILLYIQDADIYSLAHLSRPEFGFFIPEVWALKHGFFAGVLPQLPLTFLNSIVAVCALSSDYFPGRGISPKKMTLSVGLMNLFSIPFGGIPICHGSGGLAAQYRFGARTGGSVIMLGVVKIAVGLLLGGALFTLLQNYPASILGVMLIFAGLELAKTARDHFNNLSNTTIVFLSAGVTIWVNTFAGFLVGLGLWLMFRILRKDEVT